MIGNACLDFTMLAALGWGVFVLGIWGTFRTEGAAQGFCILLISMACTYLIVLAIALAFTSASYSCMIFNYKLALAKMPPLGVEITAVGDRADDSNRIRRYAYRVGWAANGG